jgi:CHASE3 domain sensor protein
MKRLLVTCALFLGCNASTETPESEANQAELAQLTATHTLDLAIIAELTSQIDALATEVERNSAKVGVSDEQAEAIVANSAKAGVSDEQAVAIVANSDKVGINGEQAVAIVANSAKVGLSESQIAVLDHAQGVAAQGAVSTSNVDRFDLPTYTGNETPAELVRLTVPSSGRYIVFLSVVLVGSSYCRLQRNNNSIENFQNSSEYIATRVLALEVDDEVSFICSGNVNGRRHHSSSLSFIPIL